MKIGNNVSISRSSTNDATATSPYLAEDKVNAITGLDFLPDHVESMKLQS
jgi:hypothetical protein